MSNETELIHAAYSLRWQIAEDALVGSIDLPTEIASLEEGVSQTLDPHQVSIIGDSLQEVKAVLLKINERPVSWPAAASFFIKKIGMGLLYDSLKPDRQFDPTRYATHYDYTDGMLFLADVVPMGEKVLRDGESVYIDNMDRLLNLGGIRTGDMISRVLIVTQLATSYASKLRTDPTGIGALEIAYDYLQHSGRSSGIIDPYQMEEFVLLGAKHAQVYYKTFMASIT